MLFTQMAQPTPQIQQLFAHGTMSPSASTGSMPLLRPMQPHSAKKPKLSLDTHSLPVTFSGKSSTALSIAAVDATTTPTTLNTFQNAFDLTARASPISATTPGNQSDTPSHLRPLLTRISTPTTNLKSTLPAYTLDLPRDVRPILKNTPYPLEKSIGTGLNSASPRSSRKVFFPPPKKVAWKDSLEEVIATTIFVKRHSDLILEERASAGNGEGAGEPDRAQIETMSGLRQIPTEADTDQSASAAELSRSAAPPALSLQAFVEPTRQGRPSPSLLIPPTKSTSVYPKTPVPSREFVDQLNAHNTEQPSAQIQPSSQGLRPNPGISSGSSSEDEYETPKSTATWQRKKRVWEWTIDDNNTHLSSPASSNSSSATSSATNSANTDTPLSPAQDDGSVDDHVSTLSLKTGFHFDSSKNDNNSIFSPTSESYVTASNTPATVSAPSLVGKTRMSPKMAKLTISEPRRSPAPQQQQGAHRSNLSLSCPTPNTPGGTPDWHDALTSLPRDD